MKETRSSTARHTLARAASLLVLAFSSTALCSPEASVDSKHQLDGLIDILELQKSGKTVPIPIWQTGDSSNYRPIEPVDIKSDIIIVPGEKFKQSFIGKFSARARILRKTPVELPVENYTVVSENKLQQESVFSVPDSDTLFRDEKYDIELEKAILALNTASRGFNKQQEIIKERILAFKAKAAAPDTKPEDIKGAALEIRDFVDRVDSKRAAFVPIINAAREKIQELFLNTYITSVVTDETFKQVREGVRDVLMKLSDMASVLEEPYVSATNAISVCTTESNEAKASDCYRKAIASLESSGSSSRFPRLTRGGAEASEVEIEGIVKTLGELRDSLAPDIIKTFKRRLPVGRLKLSMTDLRHGEVVEILLRSSVPRLEQQGSIVTNKNGKDDEFVLSIRLRVVEEGLTYTIHPQYVLVTRVNDDPIANEESVPSLFKPAPGASLTFRWRRREELSDLFIPSLGLSAVVPDFDPNQAFELGVGASVGWLNDMVHAGVGVNLSVRERPSYWFISLDFLQGVDTFSAMFGPPGASTAINK